MTTTQPSKAWADETDEDDAPRNTTVNAWAKGNPLVANVPTHNHNAHVDEEHYENDGHASKPYQPNRTSDDSRRDDDRSYPREDKRYSQYSEDRNYDQRRPREDNYNNFSRGRGGGGRDGRDGEYRDNGRRQSFGGEGRGYRDREPREPREQKEPVPFPTQAPYTAFVGNLPYDITKDELFDFFSQSCAVLNVRLLMNRETNRQKGFGYVEFQDLESLKQAVQLNGETLIDRPLRIDVAEAKPDDKNTWGSGRNDRGRGERSDRGDRYNNNRSFGSGFRDGGERDRRPEDRDRRPEDRDRRPEDRESPRALDPQSPLSQSPLERPKNWKSNHVQVHLLFLKLVMLMEKQKLILLETRNLVTRICFKRRRKKNGKRERKKLLN